MSLAVTAAISFIGFAAALLTIGRWGRRRAGERRPRHVTPGEWARRASVMRRGAIACQVAGAAFAVAAVVILA
jgi:hypothetical protein